MGFYTRLNPFIPKQSCVLCGENAKRCICCQCRSEFTNHQSRCKSCAHPTTNNLDFCGQCLIHSPQFNRAYTLYDYQGAIADLIKIFKYNHRLCVGDYFAHQLADFYAHISPKYDAYDAIIPMPLSRMRTRERGYNQVLELLRVIARHSHANIDAHSVQRIKATMPLSLLKPEQRRAEIKDAFAANTMKYQKALLVDDVMTTGASLNELAKTVLKAGVQSVDVLILARVDSNHKN